MTARRALWVKALEHELGAAAYRLYPPTMKKLAILATMGLRAPMLYEAL